MVKESYYLQILWTVAVLQSIIYVNLVSLLSATTEMSLYLKEKTQ